MTARKSRGAARRPVKKISKLYACDRTISEIRVADAVVYATALALRTHAPNVLVLSRALEFAHEQLEAAFRHFRAIFEVEDEAAG